MTDDKFLKDLDELVEKLDSSESRKAWGEIIIRLIKSNTHISENMLRLIHSMDQSSVETTRINRRIMYLTVAVALSAIVTIIRDLIEIIK